MPRHLLDVNVFLAATIEADPRNWIAQEVVPLSRHYRVLCADLPGLGDSDRLPGEYTADNVAAAVLRGITVHTPLVPFGRPELRHWLKAGSLQPIGPFKLRGAYVAGAALSPAARARGPALTPTRPRRSPRTCDRSPPCSGPRPRAA